MKQEVAEILALNAVSWLAGNEDLIPVFLGSTGASVEDLRSRAGDPEFLGSVLDFILMDDAWIAAFCASAGLQHEDPMKARQALPGGSLPEWT